jgi:cytochrome c551/c552
MKKTLIALAAVAALGLSATASADEATAKTACGKCHLMDKEKNGPSYKDLAKKFKGKDVAAVQKAYKDNKEHSDSKATDDQVKKVSAWLLTL